MRVAIVWKDYTDHSREVIDWSRDFEHRTGKQLENLDPDTIAGENFCTAYGILEYPTIIAIAEPSGIEQKRWSGTPLPLIDEVSYYTKDF